MNELYSVFIKYYFLNPIIIFVFLLGLFCFLFESKIIGFFGELWTKKDLKKLPKEYKILNNIMIKSNNSTYQIDHIVVSKYGIFVIETKQYNGFITGDKFDSKWVRHVGKKKYYYTNPIKQNYGHILSLSEFLDVDKNKFINIVSIPSAARLRIKDDGEVVRYGKVKNKIISYRNEIVDNVDEITEILLSSNIKANQVKKEHIKNLKSVYNADYSKLCPKCGGKLVQKSGKYGPFLACSNYPKCRYTRNI